MSFYQLACHLSQTIGVWAGLDPELCQDALDATLSALDPKAMAASGKIYEAVEEGMREFSISHLGDQLVQKLGELGRFFWLNVLIFQLLHPDFSPKMVGFCD